MTNAEHSVFGSQKSPQSFHRAYIAQHFRDLQGLRLAPLWAALLIFIATVPHGLSLRLLISVMAALAAAALGWFLWSGRWYRRHFGFIQPEPLAPEPVLSILHSAGSGSRRA